MTPEEGSPASGVAAMRRSYEAPELLEGRLPPSPLPLFRRWLEDALQGSLRDPNAMTLATVAPDGRPSTRVVLIKGLDERGIVWYTNYDSRKGRELEANPFAALQFHWPETERQVRLEGRVERTSATDSDTYFASRPLGSRIGAWVSPQSRVVTDRTELQRAFDECSKRLGADPARPPHWGGYRLLPDRWEFWQGHPNRLHDRLCYTRDGAGWVLQRLAP